MAKFRSEKEGFILALSPSIYNACVGFRFNANARRKLQVVPLPCCSCEVGFLFHKFLKSHICMLVFRRNPQVADEPVSSVVLNFLPYPASWR